MRIRIRGISDTLIDQCGSFLKTSVLASVVAPIGQTIDRMAKRWIRTTGICAIVLLTVFFNAVLPARASDHQDTTFLATKLTAADLTDLFVFESPSDPSKVVLAMDFDPLITPGEVSAATAPDAVARLLKEMDADRQALATFPNYAEVSTVGR